jgi:hypothetical protein
MVVDPHAAEFFGKQQEDISNRVCCDCGTDDATWASISHGIYLSIGAAGLHRSLGVKVSFVQSTTMDSWRPLHLRMMELGGNRRFSEFLKAHGVREDMPIRNKYNTIAAKWYRENLKAEAEGSEPPAPLLPGTGHLLACDAMSEAQQVLDKVFAKAPRSDTMTLGGIRQAQMKRKPHSRRFGTKLRHSAPAALGAQEQSSRSYAQEGAQTAHRSRTLSPRSLDRAQRRTADFGLDRWLLLAVPLPSLFTTLRSSQCPNAKRLQTLSSGKMEGFGSSDCPSELQTYQEGHKANMLAAVAA